VVWSPRRLAELAGTSRRTVRHYHELGLLPEPARRANGYQRYGVEHLVRLVRIRRLTRLGLTLPQIAALGDTERLPAEVARDLDAEITRTIAQLHEARAELAEMVEHAAPLDLPAHVARRVDGLPGAERALVVVLSRLLGRGPLDAYLDLLPPYRAHPAVLAFDTLSTEADDPTRTAVARGITEHLHHLATVRPAQLELVDTGLRRDGPQRRAVHEAIGDLYNPAQLDVLTRTLHLNNRPSPAFRR
jgi:DNA-binding transcriptional MerR regulator